MPKYATSMPGYANYLSLQKMKLELYTYCHRSQTKSRFGLTPVAKRYEIPTSFFAVTTRHIYLDTIPPWTLLYFYPCLVKGILLLIPSVQTQFIINGSAS